MFGVEYEGESEASMVEVLSKDEMVEVLSKDEINELLRLLEEEVNRINGTPIRILEPNERLRPAQDLDSQADR